MLLWFFYYNMYTDMNAQREVQEITEEHTAGNGGSDEQLEGNRLTRMLSATEDPPTPASGQNGGRLGQGKPREQGQISKL